MERNETIIGAYYITAPLADGDMPGLLQRWLPRRNSRNKYPAIQKPVPLSVINSRKASLCSVCREAQYAERYRK